LNSIKKYWLCLCLSFAVGQTGFAQAPPPPNPPPPPSAPFTMQQVVEEALAHNPVLLSSLENLLSMKGQEVQAGLRQNPNLFVSGTDVSLSANNPASPYSYDVGVNRLFERGQKRRWRLDIAQNTTAQTDGQYHDQIRQVTLQVKQSFTSLVLAKATLKLAQDNLRDYRHVLQINHDRYDAGDIGKLDYERLDLQLAQFESDESSAEMNLV
jgi:outer membrane protein, heavy metal efflux system